MGVSASTTKCVKTKQEREAARQYSARYHAENREDCLAKMRERNKLYYQRNRERLIARALEYQRKNPDERNSYKTAWNRRKKENDPQFAAITIMRKLVSRTCERIKVGRREIGKTVDALGYTTEEFRRHIESQFQPSMTWANHGQWHVDHIKALALFDLSKPDGRKIANSLANLQPLWTKDNMRKGARPIAELVLSSK
jgi:hypothetical protein